MLSAASDSGQIRLSAVCCSMFSGVNTPHPAAIDPHITVCILAFADFQWQEERSNVVGKVRIHLVGPVDAVMQVLAGALSQLWSAPLTLLAGTRQYPSYRLWQPFTGGRTFVCAQVSSLH